MRIYKVTYEAEGKEHTLICKAWSRSAARTKARQMALALGYDRITVLSIELM